MLLKEYLEIFSNIVNLVLDLLLVEQNQYKLEDM